MFIAPRACNLIEITTGGKLSYGVVISLDEYIPICNKSAAKRISRANSFGKYNKFSFSCLESANSTFRWLGFAEYAAIDTAAQLIWLIYD